MTEIYRSQLQILHDVLEACANDDTIISHIGLKTRLSHPAITKRLDQLVAKGYITKTLDKNPRGGKDVYFYKLSPEGLEYKNKMKEFL